MQGEQDQWYHEVDQEEYEPGGRYALSIQIRNLPSAWGKRGHRKKSRHSWRCSNRAPQQG